jgi:gliding motility-associated-like protein
MKTYRKGSGDGLLKLLFLLPLLMWVNVFAQVGSLSPKTNASRIPSFNAVAGKDADLFGTRTRYIENTGQYGDSLARYGQMGKILYGYEGFGMPVLFTSKGLIHLQRKTQKISYEEKERLEEKGIKGGVKKTIINRIITMEWVNANTNPRVIGEGLCTEYSSYGLLKTKARTYKKIIYKDLYPGIDVEYSFNENKKAGFEYNLIVTPGADVTKVKIKYGGDVKTIVQDAAGGLIIRSGIDEISVTGIVCYYAESKNEKFNASFSIKKNEISFKLPANYARGKTLVIDPFVTVTGGLSGADAGKAKDIDFDYAGNIYIAGGGDEAAQQLAKYDSAGRLQWIFNGSLNIPSWDFGGSHGGWVVEKVSGNIYLGQGLETNGFRVIRLNTNGVYDNYITTADPAFIENWKMLWSCDSGVPKIFIAGGGGNSNKELAFVSPPSPTLNAFNLTGANASHNDISDIILDPISNDMYTIFSASVLTPNADSRIYKHRVPYSSSGIEWNKYSGYNALHEPVNRPYIGGLDNSSNTLAINSSYLFYWDGKNLKAFNKADGSTAGTPVSVSSATKLMQGGIVADECNNVFIGMNNGTIKVYRFNGSVFDDNAAPDIPIAAFPLNAVYDMVYDQGRGLLYTCGDGFVASIDVSSYCAITTYAVNVNTNCASLSASVSVNPAPPVGAVVTYNLFTGSTQIASNTTGFFNNLTAGINYTIVAMVNQACGGIQSIADFSIASAPSLMITNPPAVCSGNMVDLTLASVTAGSATGLTFTYWLNATATIICPTPSAVTQGTYYIKGTSSAGCFSIATVVVASLPAPKANAGADTVLCSGNNLQLKGTGGITYAWTPTTYLSNPAIANPTVYNPGSGSIVYHLKVTDAAGCQSLVDDDIKISFTSSAKIAISGDTLVAMNQHVQLNAVDVNNSGFTNYLWSPAYGLNNPFIADPVAVLDKDITYTLHAGTADHCMDDAVIKIKVFRGPEIYVPNSFTPNGDGLNDVLKPIPVGLKEFHYFNVFNRFGQLLFSTTNPLTGWDGKIQGKLENSGTFVWIGEGVDFKGNIIMQKGYSTLIR